MPGSNSTQVRRQVPTGNHAQCAVAQVILMRQLIYPRRRSSPLAKLGVGGAMIGRPSFRKSGIQHITQEATVYNWWLAESPLGEALSAKSIPAKPVWQIITPQSQDFWLCRGLNARGSGRWGWGRGAGLFTETNVVGYARSYRTISHGATSCSLHTAPPRGSTHLWVLLDPWGSIGCNDTRVRFHWRSPLYR